MKIITFATLKGGTGKTSTCFNLAGLFAETKKVLLIDMDAQTNLSLNAGLDVTRCKHSTKNIFDHNTCIAKDIITTHPMPMTPNIDIIPSSIYLNATELQIINRAGRERFLFNFISDNIDFLEKTYDYILIDTNPSMSMINQNAFLAADTIFLVSDVSLNSIQGAELFIALWEDTAKQLRIENTITALLINNVDKRIKLSSELTSYCCENDSVKDIVLDTVIPSSVRIKETELEHKPINVLHKNSASHNAYMALYDELLKKEIA